jgi:hypothetical protein
MRNQILQIDGAGKLEQPCANENKQKHPMTPNESSSATATTNAADAGQNQKGIK